MEQQIVERVFQFADRRMSSIMAPRADVVCLEINDGYAKWQEEVLRSSHSRFPVCEGELDHLLGVSGAKDCLAIIGESDTRALAETANRGARANHCPQSSRAPAAG